MLQLVNHKCDEEGGGCCIYTLDTIVFYAVFGRMNRPTCTSSEELYMLHLVVKGKEINNNWSQNKMMPANKLSNKSML